LELLACSQSVEINIETNYFTTEASPFILFRDEAYVFGRIDNIY